MKNRLYLFYLFILTLMPAGCVRSVYTPSADSPCLEKIARQIPRWTLVGKISPKYPNLMRVLMLRTGNMAEALQIMKSNGWKYSEKFYRSLPLKASIYLSAGNELLIRKDGGPAPAETVTIYESVNRCNKNPPPAPSRPDSHIFDDHIVEETLTE